MAYPTSHFGSADRPSERDRTDRFMNHGPAVLTVVEHFPSSLQSYVINALEELSKRGAQITIVASRTLAETYPQRVEELRLLDRTLYVPVENLRDLLRALAHYLTPFGARGRCARRGLWLMVRSHRWRPSGVKDLAKSLVRAPLLGEGKFDLVHAHYLQGAYDYLFVSKVLEIPLIVTFHGLPTRGGTAKLPSSRAAQVFSNGEIFLVNTRFAQQQLVEMGCPYEKIRILPQGIRLEDYPFCPRPFPEAGPVRLLTVGRLSVEKGHSYALEAVRRLKDIGRKIEYRIVGRGYEKDSLEALIRRLGLENAVHLTGDLTDAELLRQYQEAHIFILPSIFDPEGYHTETQGVVIQEAQASGAIVVATRTGGIPECVEDGRSAFLVPERDSAGLADMIAWLIDHPERWPEWQRAGRTWVEERLSMAEIGQRLWNTYYEAMELHSERLRLRANK
jgi:colanic acid/amylovoran biosynthesis glycosyltransferase